MLYSFVIECGAMTSCLYYYSYIIQEAFCYLFKNQKEVINQTIFHYTMNVLIIVIILFITQYLQMISDV